MSKQQLIELNPSGEPRHVVIWLHGLGADGGDFLPLAQMLELPDELAVRFVFPNAPLLPVSINNGYVMPAWYDIYGMDLGARVDVAGISRSLDSVRALLQQEQQRGIPLERMVLAGFSQGGLIALATAFAMPEQLAGVMALSTYLPAAWKLGGQSRLEVFMAHGLHDDVVPLAAALRAKERLLRRHCAVEWHEYVMGHSVAAEEIGDIRAWLLRVFAPRSTSQPKGR